MSEKMFPRQCTEEELRRRIEAGSTNPDEYTKLAGLLFLTGRYDEAVTLYRRAIDLSLTNLKRAWASTELSRIFYQVNEFVSARALAEQALTLLSGEQEGPEVLACRGTSQAQLAYLEWVNDLEAGKRTARLALETLELVTGDGPDHEGKAVAYFDAAILNIALGDRDKAITLCEKSLQCELWEWEYIAGCTIYGEALRGAGQFAEAQQKFEEAIRYAKNNEYNTLLPNLYLQLGITRRLSSSPADTQQLREALHTFQEALHTLELDPYRNRKPDLNRDICMNLAPLCYELGDFRRAMAAYEEVLLSTPEGHPYYLEAQRWIGRCQQAMGNYANSQSFFQKVLMSPNASEEQKLGAREDLARSLYELREYRKTSDVLHELLACYPKDDLRRLSTILWQGYCYEGIGQHAKAVDCFEAVLSSPNASEDDKNSAREGLRRLPPSSKPPTYQ